MLPIIIRIMPIIGIPPEDPGIDPVGVPCAAGVPVAAGDDVLIWARTALAEAVRIAATKRTFREDNGTLLPDLNDGIRDRPGVPWSSQISRWRLFRFQSEERIAKDLEQSGLALAASAPESVNWRT